tara:strand:+ start:3092 stop:3649 length:558 start_codon:yes stop_codon:yes gene_type:complete
MTSKTFIGLDRDGVINTDLGRYCTHPKEFEPIPGSLESIANLRYQGYGIVIITNQGGIAKGQMTIDDVESVHNYMLDLLGKAGCPDIDGIYFSESSEKNDPYAKPNAGMFKTSQKEIKELRWSHGFYVGDKMTDLKAAMKVGARPVLVRTGYGEQTERDLNKYTYKSIKRRSYVFDSLQDFAENL